jgi:hypothetical protein
MRRGFIILFIDCSGFQVFMDAAERARPDVSGRIARLLLINVTQGTVL